MIRAGGTIFVCLKTKRICLFLRSRTSSSPMTWGFAGGKIEKDETIISGIAREIKEEIGFIPKSKKVLPIDVYKSTDGNFIYYSVIILVEKEFLPKLNEEHGGFGWFNIDSLPKPLHTGSKIVLMNKNFRNNFGEILKDNL